MLTEPGNIQERSPAKRALLLKLMREKAAQAKEGRAIPRRARRDSAALSFAQQRLWFLDQLGAVGSVYNCPYAVRLSGRLDVDVFRRTFAEIVRRHEVLRTTFTVVDGEPRQVIAADAQVSFSADALDGADEAEVRRSIVEEARRPFDLTRGPLLRVRLVRLSEEEHVLLLVMHHIISDGWSMGVLVKEVVQLYAAFARGEASPLGELPIQYADFAEWQRGWLRDEALERQLTYWREQLGGALPLELPIDYSRPSRQTFGGASIPFTIRPEVSESLSELSRREGVTLFMTLLAAFQALLSRYSSQTDISVGTAIANRNRAETEGLIGFFVNTLVLRTDLSGDPTFAELLKRARVVALGAYAHQDVPFEKLVEELQPERDPSRTPLFQVMMVLQNAPGGGTLGLPGLTLGHVETGAADAKFDLTLTMTEGDEGLSGALQYNTALYEGRTIRRMIGHFERLLEAAAADPRLRLSELPLLSPQEQRQLLVEWNDTAVHLPHGQCFQHLFERQAALTPDATALTCGSLSLSYHELDERADALARRLRSLGARPESLVGVFMERSTEMVVALLGVLKAGAAYVPFDPAHPAERLRFMLEDAAPRVIFTQQHLAARLAEHLEGSTTAVLCLDSEWEEIARDGGERLESGAAAENLAYVIYTSGSTGRPKGVCVTHRGLVNYLCWAADAYRVAEGRGALVHSPVGFDLTVTSLFTPLVVGRAVTLLPEGETIEALIQALLAGRDFSLLKITPAHLEVLSQLLPPEEAAGRARVLVIGGEALHAEALRFWRRHAPATRLINEYGPTETVVGCCVYEVAAGDPETGDVPIGRPIANTQLFVLDQRMRPVPVGASGELYIAGEGLARGYLGRAAVTAERFVPNPFAARPGSRLYRTGDLARHLADGRIEFTGRNDGQVKIRGHRIELGEIEAALLEQDGLWQAAVVALEEGSHKRLVAYVVAEEGKELSAAALRESLKRRLPEYMTPSAFVSMAELPLTSNGKLDRRALPAPDEQRLDTESQYEAPRTPTEDMLAVLWGDVLGVERVGIHDNFFELGGHSLLAAKLAARVKESFGVELPLRVIFEAQDMAGLAEAVEKARRSKQAEGEHPLKRLPREGTLPLSFTQEHVWTLSRLTKDVTGPRRTRNMNAIFRLKGPLKLDVMERTLAEMGRRHEILRTTYAEVEGQLLPSIAPTLPSVLSVVDLQALSEPERVQEARRRVTDDARRPFDLAGGVLLRATLLRLAAQDYVLAFAIDHFIFDGWSKEVFLGELAAIYQAFYHDQPSPLPELEFQFIDWAAWQRSKFGGEAAEKFIDFWRERLDMNNPFPKLELPQVLPPPAVLTRRGQAHRKVLPRTVLEKLEALGRDKRVTMFMMQLAVLNTVLHACTGKEQIGVVTDIANRERAETQRLFGWITNQLVVPTDLSGNPSFSRLLERVRAMCMGVFERADLPLPYLMKRLKDGEDPVAPPFVFLGVEPDRRAARRSLAEKLRLADLAIEQVSLEPSGLVTGTGIVVNVEEIPEGLRISIESGVDQYRPETMAELLEFYCRVVESVVADPEQTLSELTTLLREEVEISG